MKHLWFTAILAASATACVEANPPVQIINVVPYDPESDKCEPGDIALSSGTLNFDVSNDYRTTLSLASPVVPQQGTTGIAFEAQELIYSYESINPSTTFEEESRPILFSIPAGAEPGETWMGVNLIGDAASRKLEGVVPTSPDVMTLLVTVKLKGKLAAGGTAETNEITFPIRITREGGCPPGEFPIGSCASPGQDGPTICSGSAP